MLIFRQLTARPLARGQRAAVVLGVIGLASAASYLQSTRVSVAEVVALLAWPRASVTRIWRDESGQWWRQGRWAALTLWLLAIAAHIAISRLLPPLQGQPRGAAGFDQATIVLYIAVSLGAQLLFLNRRVARLSAVTPPKAAAVLQG